MMNSVTYFQMLGLQDAKATYQERRKLGHAHSSALEAAVTTYAQATGESRAKAQLAVGRFIELDRDIPGGAL